MPLRPDGAALVDAAIEPTGATRRILRSQDELAAEEGVARVVAAGTALAPEPPPAAFFPDIASGGARWGMVIDTDACTGWSACVVACQAENNVPTGGADEFARGRDMHWLRIDRYANGAHDVFQPVPCTHCETAPFEPVCPVGASVHDGEGLNVQVYNRCVGTRFCQANCPDKVRKFNFQNCSDPGEAGTTSLLAALHNPDVSVRGRGVMEKCTCCVQRISRARRRHRRGGRDRRGDDRVPGSLPGRCDRVRRPRPTAVGGGAGEGGRPALCPSRPPWDEAAHHLPRAHRS